jgi:hypothetical protein
MKLASTVTSRDRLNPTVTSVASGAIWIVEFRAATKGLAGTVGRM